MMDNTNDSSFLNESELRLSTSLCQWAGFELDAVGQEMTASDQHLKDHPAINTSDQSVNDNDGGHIASLKRVSPELIGEEKADEMLQVVREFLLEKTSQFYNDIIDAQGDENLEKTGQSMERLRQRYETLRRQTSSVIDRFRSAGIEEELNNRLKSIDAALRQLSILKSPATAQLSISSSDSGRSSTDDIGFSNASPLHQWRHWIESMEHKMSRLRQKIDWCDREQLEQRLKAQQALQSQIEQEGGHWVAMVQKYIDSWPSSHRREVVSASIERRWHGLWIKSLEWQCRLERQIRAVLLGITDSSKEDGDLGEPLAKRRRFTEDDKADDDEQTSVAVTVDDLCSDDLCSATSDTIPFEENEYEPLTPRSVVTTHSEPNSARDGGYSSGSSAVVTRFEVEDEKPKVLLRGDDCQRILRPRADYPAILGGENCPGILRENDCPRLLQQNECPSPRLLQVDDRPRIRQSSGSSPCLERRTRIENSPVKNFYQMTPSTPDDPTPTATESSNTRSRKPIPSRLSEDALYVYTQPFVVQPPELTDSLLVNVGDTMSETLDNNNQQDDLEEILNLFRQGQDIDNERDPFEMEFEELLLRRQGTSWVPLVHNENNERDQDDDEAEEDEPREQTPTAQLVETPPNTPSLLMPPKLNLPRISSSGSLKRRRRDMEMRRSVTSSQTAPCNVSDLAAMGMGSDRSRMPSDHGRMPSDHGRLVSDQSGLVSDHGRLVSDHSGLVSDHSGLVSDHGMLLSDHITTAHMPRDHSRIQPMATDHAIDANLSASWPPFTPSDHAAQTSTLLNNSRSGRKKLRACRLRRSWSYGVQLENPDDDSVRMQLTTSMFERSGLDSPARPNTAVSNVGDERGESMGSSQHSMGGSGCVMTGGGETLAEPGSDEVDLASVLSANRPVWEWDDYKPPNHNENGPIDQPPLDDTMLTAFGDDYCSFLDHPSTPRTPDVPSPSSPFNLRTRLSPVGVSFDSDSDESMLVIRESREEMKNLHRSLKEIGSGDGPIAMSGKDYVDFLSACEYNINRLEIMVGNSIPVTKNGSKEVEGSIEDLLQDWRDLALLLTRRMLESPPSPPPAKISGRSRSSEEEEQFMLALQAELRRLTQSLQNIMAQGAVRSTTTTMIDQSNKANTYRSLEEAQEILDVLKAVRRSLTAEKIRLDCILQQYNVSMSSLSTKCEAIGVEVAQLRSYFEEAYQSCDSQLRSLEALRQKWSQWQQTEELCGRLMAKIYSELARFDFKALQSDMAYLEERVARVESAFSKLLAFLPSVSASGSAVSIDQAILDELKERTEALRRELDALKAKVNEETKGKESLEKPTEKSTRRKRSYNATSDADSQSSVKKCANQDQVEFNDKDKKKSRSLRRMLFRYWPIQVCLCVLVCLNIFFFYPSCCDQMNRYWWSFGSKLEYSNGPPPT